MHATGFGCGIVTKDGPCMHESRRKAIDCTRRMMQVDLKNQLQQLQHELNVCRSEAKVDLQKLAAEKDAEIARLQKANEGFIQNVNDRDAELMRCKEVLEVTMKDKEKLIAQITELEIEAGKIGKLVCENHALPNPADNHTNVGMASSDAPEQAN